jgi:hypothetical protein
MRRSAHAVMNMITKSFMLFLFKLLLKVVMRRFLIGSGVELKKMPVLG